jgi:cysteine synthase A
MICDSGARYVDTYYNDEWLHANGFDLAPYQQQLASFRDTGRWPAQVADSGSMSSSAPVG